MYDRQDMTADSDTRSSRESHDVRGADERRAKVAAVEGWEPFEDVDPAELDDH